ncbi:hypothetical protein DFH07DRAFT_560637 [Mycena maculata]|uniref:Uncharacterized protein n=1 Tax=Mycena maculata TaxID=230809 RepID=A0AAD7N7C9_9AGAR|nr:hypothetical protein DFH07DRAFT_560637 [Mycena maculata]
MNVARSSFRILARPAAIRQIHSTPAFFAKKKKVQAAALADDFFDDEEQWGVVEDLIPTTPEPKSKTKAAPTPSPVVASTSVEKKPDERRLTPGQRLHRFNTLVGFVRPRIGRHPTKRTPLVRRTVFPQLIQLSTMPEHLHTIAELMAVWKEGRLGTQGRARLGPDGHPKGAHPFDEPTSELFARRCAELGIPEHALAVFGSFATYALPLTLPAARRLLHALLAAQRPLADIATATALYPTYGLPPATEDLPSCALLLAAGLRELKSAGAGTEGAKGEDGAVVEEATESEGTHKAAPAHHKTAEALVYALLPTLQTHLAATPPMPESRDVRDKTVRGWLKGVTRDLNEFLQGRGRERAWLEGWMVRSRFIATPSTQ